MKKESLSVMTVKTLLAVLLFAGIGTIIIGGGCIVWEYSKNKAGNQIVKPADQELNIIGYYANGVMSMCAQNCDRYLIGFYELVNELKDVDGNDRKEILFANGNMVKITELPTIAGPDSHKRTYPDKIETAKFKIDNYQRIDFPKISISKEDLLNYLENKDAEFIFKFVNPLNQELRFKFSFMNMNANYDFQYVVLKPKETKNIKYIYKKDIDLKYKRKESDSFDLMVINDFVDDNSFKRYYWNEANDFNSNGTIIYVEKFIRLEDCIEPDTSNWQIYRNEEFGFEVKYPKNYILEKNSEESINFWTEDRYKLNSEMMLSKGASYLSHNLGIEVANEKWSKEKIDENLKNNEIQKEEIYLNNIKIIKFLKKSDEGNIYLNCIQKNNIYIVIYKNDSTSEKEFDQILSTFKFID